MESDRNNYAVQAFRLDMNVIWSKGFYENQILTSSPSFDWTKTDAFFIG